MYETYTRQSLPSKRYRELIGTAICVFNSNNSFIIENILRVDTEGKYTWYELIDMMSGNLKHSITVTITKNSDSTIADLFNEIVSVRNRIIHSFQVGMTDDPNNQMLATKHKDGRQEYITEEYLLNFIKKNEELSIKMHEFRGF